MHYDNYNLHCVISIHALLAESDSKRYPVILGRGISIHALLAESDVNGVGLIVHIGGFLSTLSLRRATIHRELQAEFFAHFYPRSPCGERLVYALKLASPMLFLSTLSLRRATRQNQHRRK